MALVIDLKPNEALLVGNTLITNDKQRTRLRIDGDAPILREKDTMQEADADTPSKKMYFIIQNMYLLPVDKAMEQFDNYFVQLHILRDIAPHIDGFLNSISAQILQGTYYKAMKLVQELINAEGGDVDLNPQAPDGVAALSSNAMEAQLLKQSADQLDEYLNRWEGQSDHTGLEGLINYNRKLWMVFFDGVNDAKNSKNIDGFDVQSNIINLYNFIYKRSAKIIETPTKTAIKTLIDINRETAKALTTA
jgi:flagellar protein FlbT